MLVSAKSCERCCEASFVQGRDPRGSAVILRLTTSQILNSSVDSFGNPEAFCMHDAGFSGFGV